MQNPADYVSAGPALQALNWAARAVREAVRVPAALHPRACTHGQPV
jgi:hypothetical protein